MNVCKRLKNLRDSIYNMSKLSRDHANIAGSLSEIEKKAPIS